MNKIFQKAFINAIATTLYIILIASFMFSLQSFAQKDVKTVIIPIAMLLLFVLSAALTGSLVFGKPIMLYIDGKKKEAISLFAYTIGMLFLITLIAFIFLIAYYNLFY